MQSKAKPVFRRLVHFAGWTAAGLVTLVVLALGTVYLLSEIRLRTHYDVQLSTLPVSGDAAVLARGAHVATIRGCVDCHGANLAGRPVIDDPLVGHLHAPNLTRGSGGLAAEFSDQDLDRAIRHGVSPQGRPYVLMPSHEFATLSDDDTTALISYLKSVPPVDRLRGPVTAGPLGRALIVLGQLKVAAEHIDHDTTRVAAVPAGVTVEYGRYLATSCVGCHGTNYAGGKIAGAPPDWPAAANLTPHTGGNLTKWSERDFMQTLRTVRRPDGSELNPAMPRVYGEMTDQELQALYLFLRSLPAVETSGRDS
jgi:mono/diheme cytochrome c family protein